MKDNQPRHWYELTDAGALDSPALVFYPDRIAHNIDLLINSIGSIGRLRPHVKTHKSAEITGLMLQKGITRFKCATIAEAEMLGMAGAPDVLLAYQPVGPKLARYVELMTAYPATRFSCVLDNEASLHEFANIAQSVSQPINAYLDLDLGMNRTGIHTVDALHLYRKASQTKGLNILGLHAYDGHIHEPNLESRQNEWQTGWNAIMELKKQLMALGLPEPILVAGGTPTYPFYAAEENVECSPGTFALWDKGYMDSFTEQEYEIAALLLTRVISMPSDGSITVDLGHKAVAAESELTKRVYFLNAPDAKILSQSEEHLVLEVGTEHGFRIGDVLYAMPKHICPTVALYERAAVVVDHHLTGEWMISSRNRKINI